MITDSIEYKLIAAHYGDRVAKRSQVPLINHINEGLVVLEQISATPATKKAFCLHPLLQTDDDLKHYFGMVATSCDTWAVALAMEYRSVANEYLSFRMIKNVSQIRLSPLFEVTDMLVADKVQNCKDFITYHKATHPRSRELHAYFDNWLDRLEIDEAAYQNFCSLIDQSKPHTIA